MNVKGLDYTCLTLSIIGAINWGLIGIFRFDLVAFLWRHELALQDHLYTGRSVRIVSDQYLRTHLPG